MPELVGLARTMRSLAAPVETARDDLVDTAGTGGGPSTFNVSTTAALVAAGAGCAVAKHGNRSSTSQLRLRRPARGARRRHRARPRAGRPLHRRGRLRLHVRARATTRRWRTSSRSARSSAVRTIFNFLGPLTNPAGADAPAARRLRPPLPGDDRRGAGRARQRARAGRLRRGRPRRALDLGPHPGDRGRRRRHRGVVRRAAASSASRRPSSRRSPAARRRRTPPSSRAVLAGEAGPAPRPRRCSTPAPRSTSAAAPPTSPAGVEQAAEAIDSGAGARRARAAGRGDRRARRPS